MNQCTLMLLYNYYILIYIMIHIVLKDMKSSKLIIPKFLHSFHTKYY